MRLNEQRLETAYGPIMLNVRLFDPAFRGTVDVTGVPDDFLTIENGRRYRVQGTFGWCPGDGRWRTNLDHWVDAYARPRIITLNFRLAEGSRRDGPAPIGGAAVPVATMTQEIENVVNNFLAEHPRWIELAWHVCEMKHYDKKARELSDEASRIMQEQHDAYEQAMRAHQAATAILRETGPDGLAS